MIELSASALTELLDSSNLAPFVFIETLFNKILFTHTFNKP